MQYYSTNHNAGEFSFKQAVLKGLAPDRGLFMPAGMPELPAPFFEHLPALSFPELACQAARPFVGPAIEDVALREIVEDAIDFDAPLRELSPGMYVLELFHGPTLAFKDFGARFMARVMSHFVRGARRALTVLAATSGDTGSAVGSGFLGAPGINVAILYPKGKISRVQEMQLATLGANITAIEVSGAFDDCQRLVKEAFLDQALSERLWLTSANSINIARLIPQCFYYLRAWAQLPDRKRPTAVCVPSGNFGNLTAGLMAKRMGLPAAKFVAATNINDVVPAYLAGAPFCPRPSRMTISNAMDVGDPSNFARMLDLYGGDRARMQAEIEGFGFTDVQTRDALREVFEKSGYVLDPHGAVGWLGLTRFLKSQSGDWQGIFLETAHPAKFYEIVEPVIGCKVPLPESLERCLRKQKLSIEIKPELAALKKVLLRFAEP